jgi:transposase
LVTAFQFLEHLSDRQAADAVRARIDWKRAPGLELADPGFHFSVLAEFRARLVAGRAERLLLDAMLERFKDRGLVEARGKQRTDSTHALAAAHDLHLLELVAGTLRAALDGPTAPATAREVPVVRTLGEVWRAHYARDDGGRPRWRSIAELPPVAERMQSPHDPEARFSMERRLAWVGYKVHVTEACDGDAAHLITHVRTCPAMRPDVASTAEIHE